MTYLSVQHIYYARQHNWILENICFDLSEGQLLFITGNNGSGKTSLLRIVCGLVDADQGEVIWDGQAITASKSLYNRRMSYVGHKDGLKDDLTVAENIHMMGALYRDETTKNNMQGTNDNLDYFIQAMALPNPGAMAVTLSSGQRRRLALSRCLIAKRKLWILDEPFTALDKHGIELFQQHLSQHLDKGGMVIMASHQPIDLPANNVTELNLS